jgi:hypothetical protein
METGISLYDALVSVNVAPDKARSLVQAMEKEMFDKLASKQDLQRMADSFDQKLQLVETRLKHDLTIRVGAMMTAGFAMIGALIKFAH